VILPARRVLWEMNTLMKRQTLSTNILSLACALAALAAPQGRAQSPTGAGADTGTRVHLAISHGHTLAAGGFGNGEARLSNIVSVLRERSPGAQIVVGNDLGQLEIGDLQLRDAPLDLALQALSVASGNKFVVREQRSKEDPSTLYMLETNQAPPPPKPETTVEAFNLTGYIQHIKQSCPDTNKWDEAIQSSVDRLRDIIVSIVHEQEAFDKGTSGPEGPRRFEFFKDANLLILLGPPDAVSTASTIINALPGEEKYPRMGRWDPFAHGAGNQADPGQLQTQKLQMQNMDLLEKLKNQ
jgi:hypothetical protein